MFRLDWLQAGRATRGTPRRDQARFGRLPALLLLACVALLQSGCQSGPFSNCGSGSGLFSPCGFFGRVQSRIFNRSNGGCCGGSSAVVSDGVVEGGTVPSVVTPVVPSYPSGTSTGPTISTPSSVDSPSALEPVEPTPRSKIGPPPGNGGPTSSAVPKASYQARRQGSGIRMVQRQDENLPKTTVSTPEPTSRSAQAGRRSGANDAGESDDQDPLDHIPPLDLPGEVTRSSATPPPAPAAVGPAAKAHNLDNKAPDGNPGGANPAAARAETPGSAANELDLTSATIPAPDHSPSASVGPGIARFVAVDVKLAGGSAPNGAGLNWLVEKGYRTVLDLRESSEVPSSFIAEVTNLGLRYVALPIGLKSIDRDHLGRFNFEIAAGEARPLFFFDSDGTRAGALWYIRRVTSDRVDRQIARREAEELGLSNPAYWGAVANFVTGAGSGSQSSANSGAVGRGPMIPPASLASASSAPRPEAAGDAAPTSTARIAPDAGAPADLSAVTGLAFPQSNTTHPTTDPALPSDTLVWRPLAAMMLTGLSLPLAYWSRTVVPTILEKARASLPAPAHRPKSLPGELGA